MKKPSTSEMLYLKPAVAHQLGKVENTKFTDKHEWEREYERLRVLAWRLRKNAGFSWWVPLLFATALALVFLAWLATRTRHTHFYQYPQNYLRIVQNLDPCQGDGSCGYRFTVQAVTDGRVGPETEMHFCRGLQPRFEAGHTLSWIRYTDLGSCQAIDGYDVVRENGFATLPDNCRPDYSLAPVAGHIACEGGKARF